MRPAVVAIVLLLVVSLALGERMKAESSAEVSKFLSDHRHSSQIIALFFKKTPEDANSGGVFASMKNKVFNGVANLFSKELTPEQFEDQIEKNESILIEIDINNPELKEIEEFYHVTTVPYLVIMKNYDVLYEGIPDIAKLKLIMEQDKV